MLHCKKALLVSGIAVLFASCSANTGSNTVTSDTDSANSPPTETVSSSPTDTASSTQTPSVSVPGVNNVGEINFKAGSKNSSGFFDAVNGSNAPRIEVQKTQPVTVSGWAVVADEGKLPDRVIITYGDNNSLVAVTPVNLERTDVVKLLKNPAYKYSGWTTTFNSSTLPSGPVVLKAWSYNAAKKEATQLAPTHQVVMLE